MLGRTQCGGLIGESGTKTTGLCDGGREKQLGNWETRPASWDGSPWLEGVPCRVFVKTRGTRFPSEQGVQGTGFQPQSPGSKNRCRQVGPGSSVAVLRCTDHRLAPRFQSPSGTRQASLFSSCRPMWLSSFETVQPCPVAVMTWQ